MTHFGRIPGQYSDDSDFHFCSGVNSPDEVVGLALSGKWVGITATLCSKALLDSLKLLRGGLNQVFVDSGAFSEVQFSAAGREVVKEITHKEWQRRLALYTKLCTVLRPRQVWCVAPDSVGDQAETLVRLQRYAPQVRELAACGANVIVVAQGGELSLVEFVQKAASVLWFDNFVIGIPCKKAATSPQQVAQLCSELRAAGFAAPRFHLLGLGPQSSRFAAVRAAIAAVYPDALVHSDSVDIRAMVGRTNGRNRGPRALTAAQDTCRAQGMTPSEVKCEALLHVGFAQLDEYHARAAASGWVDPELVDTDNTDTDNDDDGLAEFLDGYFKRAA